MSLLGLMLLTAISGILYFNFQTSRLLKVEQELKRIKHIVVVDAEQFAKEILPSTLDKAMDDDPHPATRTYLQKLSQEIETGNLLLVVKSRYREEHGKIFKGVGAEYIHSQKCKSGKHEIQLFFPAISRFLLLELPKRQDFLISLLCHEWMHYETYRVYGELLNKHPEKQGFTEFLVWTNQIRSQLLDWKKQGRFLTPSQRDAAAAYERYWEGEDKKNKEWMNWVRDHLVY